MKKVKKENKKLQKLLKKEKDEKSADVEKQTKALQHLLQKPVNDKSYTGGLPMDIQARMLIPTLTDLDQNHLVAISKSRSEKRIFDIFKVKHNKIPSTITRCSGIFYGLI